MRELQTLYDTRYENTSEPILTEFDCPLLNLTTNIFVLPTSSICSSISIAHLCSHTCTYSSDCMSYSHDFSNTLFCYNIYCINNN